MNNHRYEQLNVNNRPDNSDIHDIKLYTLYKLTISICPLAKKKKQVIDQARTGRQAWDTHKPLYKRKHSNFTHKSSTLRISWHFDSPEG